MNKIYLEQIIVFLKENQAYILAEKEKFKNIDFLDYDNFKIYFKEEKIIFYGNNVFNLTNDLEITFKIEEDLLKRIKNSLQIKFIAVDIQNIKNISYKDIDSRFQNEGSFSKDGLSGFVL